MKRSEISSEYKWDLEKIYKNINEWNKDYKDILSKISDLEKKKDHILDNANNFYDFMKITEDISLVIDKLYVYAHMHSDEDTSNTNYQTLVGKAQNLYVKYSENTSWVEEYILKNYDKILKFINEKKELEYFKKDIDDIYRYKDHILSDKEEKILSSLSKVLSASSESYSYLTDTDLKFGNIIDESGNEVELTESNYSIYRTSSDRRVRKDSFILLHSTYSNYKNTIASNMDTHINSLCKISSIRGFSSSMEASLFNEEITCDIYNNLIDNISNNLDKLFKYFDLKKDILGVDEFHIYDSYAKIIKDLDKEYSFSDAKELVIEATKVLGEDYTNNLKKAFSEKWIDVYPNECKRGGAYSGGSYLTLPYLLLNFEGRYDDVSTLAHELGHSMHSYYSRKNNGANTADYKIFVAEVASLVNELLLAKYMIKNSTNREEKLFILNELLDLYKATIFRQVMFAEFERYMNKLVEDDEILTWDLLSDKYYELNKKYFGSNIVVDEEIKYEWMRIPHFYYNFYVYKYAIGLCCASRIVDNILSGKENATSKYLNFLSSGCKKSPLELLKDTDCDLSNSDVILSAMKIFDDLIDEFKDLYFDSNNTGSRCENGKERLL